MSTHAALVVEQRVASPSVRALNARLAPVSPSEQAVSAQPEVPRGGIHTGHDSPGAAILVVESDEVLGAAIVEQLAADGYRAELARTAEHARILAARCMPKLAVIGDLDMPRGALELLGEIRATDRERALWARELSVIVVSSRAHQLDVLRAFEAGADDFLARPARYLELRARLRAVLRRSESVAEGERLLQVGPLVIDVQAHAVSLHGQRLDLRRLEYELLVQLASAPDRVFGKEELLRSVWGYRSGMATRTVDSHASRLRRKLVGADDHPPGRWVVNVWGVGYYLYRG
jgi:DNA-binding response OmpR family regulator